MAAKQKILPFFLPMAACPQRCVYCDQRAISGQQSPPTAAEISAALAAFPPDPQAELAYYGGSFTCLPRETQAEYLALAAPALAAGRIGGVRVSARPEVVDGSTCAFLAANGVTTVELGVQSFDDQVLTAAGRGYTAAQASAGCQAVVNGGLRLGVQLMTGLPQDSPEQAVASLEQALALGARLLRFYPTLVLAGTELAQGWQRGEYQPQSREQAVSLCADLLTLALAAGATVQRIGLHPSPSLEQALLAGPYHPALGGLVREELRQRQLAALLGDYDPDHPALLRFCRQELPLVFGHQRQRLAVLGGRWPALALVPDDSLPPGQLLLDLGHQRRSLSQQEYVAAVAASRSAGW